jgi:hypothetical protein
MTSNSLAIVDDEGAIETSRMISPWRKTPSPITSPGQKISLTAEAELEVEVVRRDDFGGERQDEGGTRTGFDGCGVGM